MKKLPLIAFALFLGIALSAQKQTDTRSTGSFSSINIAGAFVKVTLKSGETEGVYLESNGTNLDDIETKVKGKSLSIGTKEGRKNVKTDDVTVVITYKNIDHINEAGRANLVFENTLKAEKFGMNVSGSGSIKGVLEVTDFKLNISGSADVLLSGTATNQHLAVSGSGDIDAGKLRGETAKVAISGSGDVLLNISGNVRSSISGSGDVVNKYAR